MRKIKEVLRLHFELRLGQRQIARSANISQSTVHEYLARAVTAGLKWPLQEDWTEERLEGALFPPGQPLAKPAQRPPPDFVHLRDQRSQHRDLTLQQLWDEYRDQHPDGYSYSRFCKQYRRWLKQQDVVLRQEHRAGEKLFVDWAGATIPIYRRDGTVSQAPLFVSALGVSSYTYAEAAENQQMPNWLAVQRHAFEFYGGCPQLLIPDNTKTGVTKACRYEPSLNPTYQEFAAHYRVGVMPARPRKPRDKAKVESAVQVVQRWIVMKLRNRRFFSVPEANAAIREQIAALNNKPFRKRREESRASLFAKTDQPALQPLPVEPYDMSQWSLARVNIDYHVAFDDNWYSVPYALVHEQVDVRSTPGTVEIYHRGQRVASHVRAQGRYEPVTQTEHRPKSHREHLSWTPSRIVEWARKTGPNTAQMVERILEDKPHPEIGYRSCLGVIRLGKEYTEARLERACARAVLTGAIGYHRVKSILKRGLDAEPQPPEPEQRPSPDHDNLRGPDYFE